MSIALAVANELPAVSDCHVTAIVLKQCQFATEVLLNRLLLVAIHMREHYSIYTKEAPSGTKLLIHPIKQKKKKKGTQVDVSNRSLPVALTHAHMHARTYIIRIFF